MHVGDGVWERGVSEFPGSEVRRSGSEISHTRYVPPQRAGFFHNFGLKTGMVFEGTMRGHESV